jgi:outer membrane receptor for ferric coprogen and ferric-rhodotorulic acid
VDGVNYEVGIKGEHFGGRLNTSLAVFRIEQDNAAIQDGNNLVPGTADFAYIGADGVRSNGFEAQVSGQLTPGWNVAGGFSRTLSTDRDGANFNPWIPRSQVRLSTSLRMPGEWSGLTVGGSVAWDSHTYYLIETANAGTVDVRQKAFTVLNLMARYELASKLTAQLNLDNLLDETYRTSLWQIAYGTPRSALLTLSYRY